MVRMLRPANNASVSMASMAHRLALMDRETAGGGEVAYMGLYQQQASSGCMDMRPISS